MTENNIEVYAPQVTQVMSIPTEPLPLRDILQALSRPLPAKMLETKSLKGQKIIFLSWKFIPPILDK